MPACTETIPAAWFTSALCRFDGIQPGSSESTASLHAGRRYTGAVSDAQLVGIER
jgi:hypothetical protein